MADPIEAFFSNRVEHLYRRLKANLFAAGSKPFTQRLVVVPSPPLKSWLMLQLARDPEVGIAAGLDVVHLDESIRRLSPEYARSTIPDALELSLAIEWEIRRAMENSNGKDPLWQPLSGYLQASAAAPLSLRSEKRLIALSEKLAALFLQYGKHGGEMVAEWVAGPCREWQPALWNRLFGAESSWNYLGRALADIGNIPPPKRETEVHLFSFSFIPKVVFRFLRHAADNLPVRYYILSPCQAFWSDIRSERESRKIQRFWKEKGASTGQLQDLEGYLKDCNPLLANFGRLGREMAQQIEESPAITSEHYSLPFPASLHPEYEPYLDERLHGEESHRPLNLLDAIQADMLLLRTPDPAAKIEFPAYDGSVQVHACPTRLREVQTLHDLLMGLFDRHKDDPVPLSPSDVIVMAPDIMTYEPFIKMVFLNAESPLDAQIMDLRMPSQNALVQGYLHLLNLSSSRWDAGALRRLFSAQHFQKKMGLATEELACLDEWIREGGIRWGLDSVQRDELLQKNHCRGGMLDKSGIGTWEYGLSRLITGLTTLQEKGKVLSVLPVEGMDFTQGELLGRLIHMLNSLRSDLKLLEDGAKRSLASWSQYLKCLLDAYFAYDQDEGKELLRQLDLFRKASIPDAEASYTFLSIKHHLESALSREMASYRESSLHAVRFCSLLPMRTIPAKVIALIGMHEGAFPRVDPSFSLNLLPGNPKGNYCPSQIDFDRYLFLEALLSARSYFVMSYTSFAQDDFKEQLPSLLASELLNYMDRAYAINGQMPSLVCSRSHPYSPFHKSLFEPGAVFPSYSLARYKQACAHYHPDRDPSHRFIPHFSYKPSTSAQPNQSINIRELVRYVDNPLRHYFNKGLGIYLEDREKNKIECEEKFQLSALDKSILTKQGMNTPVADLMDQADKSGKLPLGLFKELDIDRIKEDISERREYLIKLGILPDEFFMIEFSERYTSAKQTKEGHWQTPPLRLSYQGQCQVTLYGVLKEISLRGLVVHQELGHRHIVKAWPEFLALHALIQEHSLPIEPNLIFAKDGKLRPALSDDPKQQLETLLEHYYIALEHPAPLLPEWMNDLIDPKESDLREVWLDKCNDPFHPSYNEYLKWLVRGVELPELGGDMELYVAAAKELYGNPLVQWMDKRS